MEALTLVSSVATVVKIVQDIKKAVKTVRRNRKRFQELAERVNHIGEVLKKLDTDGSSTSTLAAAAMRRLEGALGRALKLVRSCQKGSVIRPSSLLVGARPIEDVNAEIDRCLLDVLACLGIANLVLASRLVHNLNAAAGGDPNPTTTDHVTANNYEDDEMAVVSTDVGKSEQNGNYEMAAAAVEVTCVHLHPAPAHAAGIRLSLALLPLLYLHPAPAAAAVVLS
ncbi:hypothetical protein GUJ93_ZPchr0011g27499 [Zizania palustris]|uniref:Mixed lineage kinase domain-containing protein n=1 Tax=Zizania palustris TaxID=103762 RepID=A0A8J5WFG0_ZIZPA|nr:hypothetical protein GUJ93_ZPchr0011g27499 [Zizania palustris]